MPAPPRVSRSDYASLTTAACANAALAAVIGVAIALIIGLCTWALAPHAADSSPEGAVRIAAGMWLLAHHVPLDLPSGELALTPLGFMAVPGLLLFVAGRQAARATEPRRLGEIPRYLIPMALTYATAAAIVAGVSARDGAQANAWAAFVAGFLMCGAVSGFGMLRTAGLGSQAWSGLPQLLRDSVVGGAVGLFTLLAAGAAVTMLALLIGFPESTEMFRALEPDVLGGIVLAVVCLCFVPNLVIWATSFSTGVGFSLGTSGSVTPRGVEYGALPVFPPLTTIPPEGALGGFALLILVAPLAAGALTGFVLYRRLPSLPPERLATTAGLSGMMCGVWLGLLSWLSSGSVAAGEFATVGPSWWQVGVVAGLEVGLVAAVVAWESGRRRWRRDPTIDLRGGRDRLLDKLSRTGSLKH